MRMQAAPVALHMKSRMSSEQSCAAAASPRLLSDGTARAGLSCTHAAEAIAGAPGRAAAKPSDARAATSRSGAPRAGGRHSSCAEEPSSASVAASAAAATHSTSESSSAARAARIGGGDRHARGAGAAQTGRAHLASCRVSHQLSTRRVQVAAPSPPRFMQYSHCYTSQPFVCSSGAPLRSMPSAPRQAQLPARPRPRRLRS